MELGQSHALTDATTCKPRDLFRSRSEVQELAYCRQLSPPITVYYFLLCDAEPLQPTLMSVFSNLMSEWQYSSLDSLDLSDGDQPRGISFLIFFNNFSARLNARVPLRSVSLPAPFTPATGYPPLCPSPTFMPLTLRILRRPTTTMNSPSPSQRCRALKNPNSISGLRTPSSIPSDHHAQPPTP